MSIRLQTVAATLVVGAAGALTIASASMVGCGSDDAASPVDSGSVSPDGTLVDVVGMEDQVSPADAAVVDAPGASDSPASDGGGSSTLDSGGDAGTECRSVRPFLT